MGYKASSPIGIFDSGMGGVTILQEVVKVMPNEDIIYYADSGNCPYGGKSGEQIRQLSRRVVDFLIDKEVKIIVVACNTATTNAIAYLRHSYPNIKFIGTEPAVKTAVTNSCTGVVGVLATRSTIDSHQIELLTERYSSGQVVIEQAGDGLVQIVEQGREDSLEAEQLLRHYIEPMLDMGIDNLVLGCTHYPFLTEQIERIVGLRGVRIINPAPSIARHTRHVLEQEGLLCEIEREGSVTFYSSAGEDYNIMLKNKLDLIDHIE